MNPAEAASKLCEECGLCCNGVIFHTVQLQPQDSPRELLALGMKLKRKKKGYFILQPCPAHCGAGCRIYSLRPERCRLFECRQLKRFTAGEITADDAMEKIRDVQQRVRIIDDLLKQVGGADSKKPLSKRCEKAMAEPVDALSDPCQWELRRQLTQAMSEMDAILDAEFRIARPASENQKTSPLLAQERGRKF